MERKFELVSKYKPSGDQPKAIEQLIEGLRAGDDTQTLLGITGSGKTFTIANVIEQFQKPTLIIAHNKTLAAQLYNEFKELFPNNAVEYFISYYDYYQPEAYIPRTDTYIEKSASINEEIDRLRHNTTRSLYERNDVIIVASVRKYATTNPPPKGTSTPHTAITIEATPHFFSPFISVSSPAQNIRIITPISATFLIKSTSWIIPNNAGPRRSPAKSEPTT